MPSGIILSGKPATQASASIFNLGASSDDYPSSASSDFHAL